MNHDDDRSDDLTGLLLLLLNIYRSRGLILLPLACGNLVDGLSLAGFSSTIFLIICSFSGAMWML